MINKNIAVLCGGWSEERLISLKSGDSVFKCLKENGYEVSKIDVKTASEAFNKELYSKFDLVFILLHGRGGEDGEIQKFFEENDIVFTGSNSQSSKITMNKIATIIGLSFCLFFLIGLATTLTRSMMIGFFDVLPVYIFMGIAIAMMIYEAFFDKK